MARVAELLLGARCGSARNLGSTIDQATHKRTHEEREEHKRFFVVRLFAYVYGQREGLFRSLRLQAASICNFAFLKPLRNSRTIIKIPIIGPWLTQCTHPVRPKYKIYWLHQVERIFCYFLRLIKANEMDSQIDFALD